MLNNRFCRTIGIFLYVTFLSSVANAKEQCSPEYSLPESQINSIQEDSSDENPVFVYFDGSLSMKGFVVDQPGQKNLYVSVIDDLQQIAENVGSKTYYHKFGNKVAPIKENEIARVIKPTFYECKDAVAKCDNQYTALQLPFKAAKANTDGTYIIVTDLFLENKQLVGSTLSALTKPLKSILKKGKSIGIFGVMSSFNGKIWGIPTREGPTMSYSEAQKRPYYIIVIGDQKNINQVRKNLEEQHFIDGDEAYKYALITSSPVSQNLNQAKVLRESTIGSLSKTDGFKFEYLDNDLAFYQFVTTKKRKITMKIKKSDFIVNGSSGVSSYSIQESLWWNEEKKCRKIKEPWKKTNHEKISTAQEKDEFLHLNVFKKAPLKTFFSKFRYFYLINIYAEQPGKASETIFEDWSIRDSEAQDFTDENPVEFKTLNLTKVIKILNSVANDAFEPKLVASIAMDFEVGKK